MARIIPYRGLNGYVISPERKPIFDESRDKLSGGYTVAVLAFCPEIGGLKHIGECEKCEFFRGHEQYEGVKCASASTIEAPEYYNKINPRKDF